jgi:hypothetical protein
MAGDDYYTTFSNSRRANAKATLHYPSDEHVQAHSRTRVHYFHDEGVGNFHYGVSIKRITLVHVCHLTCYTIIVY